MRDKKVHKTMDEAQIKNNFIYRADCTQRFLIDR